MGAKGLLGKDEITNFDSDGYLVIPKFFARAHVDDMNYSVKRILKTPVEVNKENDRVIAGRYQYRDSEFHYGDAGQPNRIVWAGGLQENLLEYSRSHRLVGITTQLLETSETGPFKSIDHLINQVHLKFPGDNSDYTPHQDAKIRRQGEYFHGVGLHGGFIQTAIALSPMDESSGTLHFRKGSHTLGYVKDFQHDDPRFANIFSPYEDISLMLNPGDLVLWGGYTFHYSNPNKSENQGNVRALLINGYAQPGVNRREYIGSGLGVKLPVPKQEQILSI